MELLIGPIILHAWIRELGSTEWLNYARPRLAVKWRVDSSRAAAHRRPLLLAQYKLLNANCEAAERFWRRFYV
jgi:hypothetical protein